MKINRKILFATFSLGIIGIFLTPFLVSCSQGTSINLKTYNINVGGEKYSVRSNAYGKVGTDDKLTTYSFNPNGKYSDEEIKKPEFIENQKETVKQNLFINVSNYLFEIINEYLYFLTRNPTIDAKTSEVSDTGLTYNATTREFELAYSLGLGEGKSTYRLKIESINFNVDQNAIWPTGNKLAYGTLVPTQTVIENGESIEKPNPYKATIEISDIILKLGFYKITGSNSFADNISMDELKNSNFKEYWKNFKFDNGTTDLTRNSFNVSLNKKLYFNIQQSFFADTKDNVTTYKSNGSIQFIESGAGSDFNTWPFVFDNSSPSDFKVAVETQTKINNQIQNLLELSNDNYDEFKNQLNKSTDAKNFVSSLISIS